MSASLVLGKKKFLDFPANRSSQNGLEENRPLTTPLFSDFSENNEAATELWNLEQDDSCSLSAFLRSISVSHAAGAEPDVRNVADGRASTLLS